MGLGGIFAQQPATDLQLALIKQPADLEGHRRLLSAEASLMGGEPVDFLLGDDPGGHGFQEHFANEHGRCCMLQRWYCSSAATQRRFMCRSGSRAGAGIKRLELVMKKPDP